MGYGKTRGEVLKIVQATLIKKRKETADSMKTPCMKTPCISQGWWTTFSRHWPELSLRKGDSFPIAREKMTHFDVFESYFKLLEETLDEHDLKDKPAQIYNCDESGMSLEHKLPKTIAKGTKKFRQITSGNKTQITVLGCANAAGQALPQWIFFQGNALIMSLAKGRCREHCMACRIRDGWTVICLQIGFLIIF